MKTIKFIVGTLLLSSTKRIPPKRVNVPATIKIRMSYFDKQKYKLSYAY
jgi:hypothetical protein